MLLGIIRVYYIHNSVCESTRSMKWSFKCRQLSLGFNCIYFTTTFVSVPIWHVKFKSVYPVNIMIQCEWDESAYLICSRNSLGVVLSSFLWQECTGVVE